VGIEPPQAKVKAPDHSLAIDVRSTLRDRENTQMLHKT